MNLAWLFGSILFVSAISLMGALALAVTRKNLQKILLYLVGFSTGALFGDAFIHLLPEAAENGFTMNISIAVLAGILFFFAIEKIVHWHHCHGGVCEHKLGTMNLIGDAIHNLIDGILIAASYTISIPLGIATTLAVIFHEIPQELADFGVLLHSGFTVRKALLFNFLSALTAFAGAAVFFVLAGSIESIEMLLVPFTAGGFIYIAGSDLIPELHKHMETKMAVMQVASIVLGMAVMALLLALE